MLPIKVRRRRISILAIGTVVVLLDVDDVVVAPLCEPQSKLFDALGNDGGAPYERGTCNVLVHHDLCGAQHALFLAF